MCKAAFRALPPGTHGRPVRGLFVLICLLLAASVCLDAQASQPVEKTLTGCVIDGQFYHIAFDGDGKRPVRAYRIRLRDGTALAPYEGKTITVGGMLLPGDAFRLKAGTGPVVESRTCSESFRKVINKEFITGYVVEAHKAARRKAFDEALALTGKALEMDPGYCETYIDRAYIHYLRNDPDAGRRDLRVVMDRRCPDREGLNFLIMGDVGKILVRQGKIAEALELYRMSLEACRSGLCRDAVNKDIRSLKNPSPK